MELSDTEDSEIETALSTLKEKASNAEEQVLQALNRLKLVEFKMKQELEDLSETQLKSKAALRQWLETRSLPKTSTFQEFFETFLEEHKQEHRLDLTDRSIRLNKDGCKLFGVGGKDVKMTVAEILERLPQIYH
jgi:hypothetical protein